MKNPIKHINDSINKPLCQKLNWIEDSDSLVTIIDEKGIKESNCDECKRLYLKAKRVGRDKTRTYVHTMRELMQVWADEMDEMIDNGLSPHRWMKFPKTQEFLKNIPLPNRPDIAYFLYDLQAAIEPTFCKHEDIDANEDKKEEVCKACKYKRIWWWEETGEEGSGLFMSTPSEKRYSSWEKPRSKED